jgi:cytochrome c-type biogenesis protein
MLVDLFLALTAGLVTVGGPCVLPLLPVVLGTSAPNQHRLRPVAIVLGFSLSFAVFAGLFAVFGSALGLSPGTWRTIAALAIIGFGLIMVIPGLQTKLLARFEPWLLRRTGGAATDRRGLKSGFVLGTTLGLVWSPCSGPVLATIMALIVAQQQVVQAGLLLLVFALGAGLPMLVIAYGGQWAANRVRAITPHANKLQFAFGVLVIVVGLGLITGVEAELRHWLYFQYPDLFFFGDHGQQCMG